MAQAHISYAAHTGACTFLLDAQGVCRRVVTRNKNTSEARIARRCLGAQYVASLDMRTEAGLVEMPTVGACLLFARIEDGRVALLKTALLERFDTMDDVPAPRPSAPELSPDPYENERLDARTRQVRSVRDAGEANPELSRKYQELLDRAARTTQRKNPPVPQPTLDAYAGTSDDEESDGPTMFQRVEPRPGGMLPKRPSQARGGRGR